MDKSLGDEEYKALLKRLKDSQQKYDKLLNERDSILQSVYNDLVYGQPVKFSLRTKLIRHCNERGLPIPQKLQQEG